MRSTWSAGVAVTLAATALALACAPAAAQGGSSELRCTQAGEMGYFVTSDRPVTCVYYRRDGAVEFYTGAFHRVGIDVGPTNAVRLGFSVRVPGPITAGALDGTFSGAGLQITLGSGFGADALIGGATGSATLTPIENVSITGLNANGGAAVLQLHYRGMEPSRYR